MKKFLVVFILVLFLAAGVIIYQSFLQNIPKTPTATINNQTFVLEVAKTEEEKAVGLSAKEKLNENAGMLFPFETPSYYSFWMKNMKLPIDIIYIRDGKIVTIHKNVQPPANPNENLQIYNSTAPADTVLEINAGFSEKYNFKEGDEVRLEDI
ncbi:MAG: hypothetical protein A2687_03390 [Candidatus Levybacteria bacterium RIFCSPHIGHO2_01_FULL_38_26]|nr:MAG: hypothetical protein A2687_03390 [Candidatus Levybacteria bacterium RIFCSPHIGHO2_01_FULL_38_26]